MSLEIRQMTVKSVIQTQDRESVQPDVGRELRALRREVLEECRRMVADERKREEER